MGRMRLGALIWTLKHCSADLYREELITDRQVATAGPADHVATAPIARWAHPLEGSHDAIVFRTLGMALSDLPGPGARFAGLCMVEVRIQ